MRIFHIIEIPLNRCILRSIPIPHKPGIASEVKHDHNRPLFYFGLAKKLRYDIAVDSKRNHYHIPTVHVYRERFEPLTVVKLQHRLFFST